VIAIVVIERGRLSEVVVALVVRIRVWMARHDWLMEVEGWAAADAVVRPLLS
jgi:hypothetical protein